MNNAKVSVTYINISSKVDLSFSHCDICAGHNMVSLSLLYVFVCLQQKLWNL